jgi:hypothetical protein
MKSRTLRIRLALFLSVFLFGIFGESWGQASLTLSCQDAFFPTQFNSGGDFFNQSASVLGMWANQGAKQTVAWRNFKTAGDDSGSNRSLQIGDEFTITISCTRAFGQIGFSLNSEGSQGSSYANNVSGSKLRINTDNYGSWYISNGSTSSSFDYNPSENTFRDYKFVIKILSPTLISANLYVNGVWFSGVQNFSLLNSNPITALSIYSSDMWDGSSNDNAFWKDCSVTATTTVELGYGLSSGNLNPGLITNGLIANSNATISNNAVFIGGNAGTSIILDQANSFSGLTTVNQNATLQLNSLSGNTVPSTNSITVTNGGTLRISSNQTLNNLTINAGGSVIVDANVQLTIDGTLSNSGTFTLKNGATFVQSTGVTSITGGGTFTVEKELSGNNSTWSSTSGRFWYMGVPMVNVARSSFGSYAAGTNRVWSYAESTKLYTDITDNTATLSAGTGYVHRRSADGTLTFSANGLDGLYRTDVSLPSLTRTAGASAGYHLISNPYMAYLDWDAVIAANGTTNIESTYYIRSAEPSNNNALISYNSNGPNYVSGGVVSIDQIEDVRYIAPMQSIWVRVGTASATGSLVMNRGMLSHQSNNPGLKNTSIFPTSARVNLVDGARFDQMLIFMNQDMSNGVDQYDSEKMFVSGAPQLYTMAAGKKLVMNGLKNNKKKISVPLYLELPTSKVYQLQLSEYIMEDGLILLEDKQEGTIQDFTINDTYAFYANSGVLSNRFVLHFYMPDAGVSAQGPSNSWVEEESVINEGGSILVSSNGRGKVTINQDIDATPSEKGSVVVRDAAGREIYNGQLTGSATNLELEAPSGIYFVSVELNGQVEVKKIFVQQ